MRTIDFSVRPTWPVKVGLLVSSTDLFFANRHLYHCEFFDATLQQSLRRWIEGENFWVWQMMDTEFRTKLVKFAESNSRSGSKIELFIRWLDRNAGVEGVERGNSYGSWQSVFSILNERPDIYPTGGLPSPLKEAIERYDVLTAQKLKPIHSFLMSKRKEWDPYASGEQLEHNLKVKTPWDSLLYREAAIPDECYLFDPHGSSSPANYFFQDFIDDFAIRFANAEQDEITASLLDILSGSDCENYLANLTVRLAEFRDEQETV
jgi:hypothetical protein